MSVFCMPGMRDQELEESLFSGVVTGSPEGRALCFAGAGLSESRVLFRPEDAVPDGGGTAGRFSAVRGGVRVCFFAGLHSLRQANMAFRIS